MKCSELIPYELIKNNIILENLKQLCSGFLSYRGKELPLGFNTAVVASFGPCFHSKSDCHGVFRA